MELDLETFLTDAQVAAIDHLESAGVGVLEEVPFPPYRVDIYLPEYHAGVEVDGPQHAVRADTRRDKELLEIYLLPIFRVKAEDARHPERWGKELEAFLSRAAETKKNRWEQAEDRCPWL